MMLLTMRKNICIIQKDNLYLPKLKPKDMEKTLLHITAQVKENYGSPENPHWKNKNGQTFKLEVDSDAFMYVKDECIKAIKTLLAKQSNAMFKYEYIDHELIFAGIDALSNEEFEKELENECKATEDGIKADNEAEENRVANLYQEGLRAF